MKNIATIVLSLVLAAAIIFGLILYGKYSDTKDSLVMSEKKLSESNEKIVQVNQEITALQGQIEKSTKERTAEFENMITMKDQKLSEFEGKIRNLESKFEEGRKANEALSTELSSKDALVKRLQGQISDLKGEKALAGTQMAQLKSSYDTNLMELKSAKGHISELTNSINMKDQRLSEFEPKLHNLEKQFQKEKETNEALRAELSSKDSLVKGLQGQISNLKGEKALAGTQVAQLKSSYDANLVELRRAKGHISELTNSISMKDKELSEFEAKQRNLEKQFQKEKETNEALRAEILSRDAVAKELKGKLESSQSRVLTLENKIAKGGNELKTLQRHLSQVKGEKDMAQTKIGQLKSTYEELVSHLKKQIVNQEVAIKTFEEKISVTFVDRIVFELGESEISPEGREILGKIGQTLKDVQGKLIRVVGHTDDVPILPKYHYKFPSNWELSAARAASVVNYLQKDLGLDPRKLEAVGRSFYDPIASNETDEGRAQNRRVNIIIAPMIE